MRLYHITPQTNGEAIYEKGVLPELSQGKRKVSWWCTDENVLWALAHTSARHSVTVDKLIVCQAHIPSDFYHGVKVPGLYYVRCIVQVEEFWGYERFVKPEV